MSFGVESLYRAITFAGTKFPLMLHYRELWRIEYERELLLWE